MIQESMVFESKEVVKLTGISERRLQYFADKEVVVPSIADAVGRPGIRRKYSLENVVNICIANKLMDFGLTIPGIKKMLAR